MALLSSHSSLRLMVSKRHEQPLKIKKIKLKVSQFHEVKAVAFDDNIVDSVVVGTLEPIEAGSRFFNAYVCMLVLLRTKAKARLPRIVNFDSGVPNIKRLRAFQHFNIIARKSPNRSSDNDWLAYTIQSIRVRYLEAHKLSLNPLPLQTSKASGHSRTACVGVSSTCL
ncbi:hypothetical protein Cgig2_004273 [Carnegiea gigantea]|uniref:Uncharacterized protein n=1 Tax=Carnegiea gigantea TaxID=171969 RepID=A0A9Q1QHS5_9CARY|nr:hypothetical protein Cgig2_004273 [Carnegiea gigantea]